MEKLLKIALASGFAMLMGEGLILAQEAPVTQLPNTMRSGSSGSSGTTMQGPPYDTGIRGPNGPMGVPDTTAVQKESSGALTRRKKPVGHIRLDAEPGLTPTPTPSPSLAP